MSAFLKKGREVWITMFEHQWVAQRAGGNPADAESYEMVIYCAVCGGDYPGDADEFPDDQYPCGPPDSEP